MTHVGERRQVSVLFADMVGFTAAVERLGEDGTLPFTQVIYNLMSDTVVEHGGTVSSFGGDSVMALFGLPEALEDGALRSCRAALAIQSAFAEAADEIERRFGLRPRMRVGVSSGVALMASIEGQDAPATAVGNTVNLASRIQNLAAAGNCLICDTTRRLVEGQVELNFDDEYDIKGVSKRRKLWNLLAIRKAATRFDASVARGLSHFVGREKELAALSDTFSVAGGDFKVVDLVGEAGLGKTRLVFEFLQQINPKESRLYRGHCAADRTQVPFYPFLEVVNEAFQIRSEDETAEISLKLKTGLTGLGLDNPENLGLLLNLLGKEPPAGSLDGLDGVLIGHRTRNLLRAMLRAECARSIVIFLIEDIHWIDSASAEFLGKIVGDGEPNNLFVLHTRRPEYAPGWSDNWRVTEIALMPLSSNEIGHLVQTRLQVDNLPLSLVEQVSKRAGGNPLFGEEILSFLISKGALSVDVENANFDIDLASSGLPESMRSLFTVRMDRLEPSDKALLQAASVIGRRFDPGLLTSVLQTDGSVGETLRRLQTLDLIHRDDRSSDYEFKHVLLRDTVYQSLLSEQAAELHLAIATALEQRNENRFGEVAGALAHHYLRTERRDLAFKYNALAGARSLGVYSLGDANRYFESALGLYQSDPGCANDREFAAFLVDYSTCSNISLKITEFIELAPHVRPILGRLGDTYQHVVFLHHYIACLVYNGRYVDAFATQQDLTAMAERLDTPEAAAYALVSELSVSCYFGQLSNEAFEAKRREAEVAMKSVQDAYLQNFFLAILAWNETSRGRFAHAYETTRRMVDLGKAKNDPRSLGYATALNALIAMLSDDHAKALEIAEQALKVSHAEFERASAEAARTAALVPLERPEALGEVNRFISKCEQDGWGLFLSGPDMMLGVALTMNGRIDEGLRHMEDAIGRREREGYDLAADWYRLFLAELYLGILSGEGEASLGLLFRNVRSLSWVFMFGAGRIIKLIDQACENPLFDRNGYYVARGQMILGLLYKLKKKKGLAVEHLRDARRIADQIGPSPFLTRIDVALADLEAAT
ncbi:ATP-binding protein [Falsiruegeria mediterranea]|uniref:ATP-binding protein n=1 Tax=Falsiruegeria mediterranea TaxID=1280832 RepID=UPI0015F2745E|nr:adenylate/guanylate cyclase domain-containing protein [Falsiruegeria mediterranea]